MLENPNYISKFQEVAEPEFDIPFPLTTTLQKASKIILAKDEQKLNVSS